jgi:hypothetical protein
MKKYHHHSYFNSILENLPSTAFRGSLTINEKLFRKLLVFKNTSPSYFIKISNKQKSLSDFSERLYAEWTGLEPATSCVTGRHSNQLNYHSVFPFFASGSANIDKSI